MLRFLTSDSIPAFRAFVLQNKCSAQAQFMSQSFSKTRDGSDTFQVLVPSKESLDMIKSFDFSSFNDSSINDGAESHSGTDTDDPFDPDDLVGILVRIPSETVQFELSSPVKLEPQRERSPQPFLNEDKPFKNLTPIAQSSQRKDLPQLSPKLRTSSIVVPEFLSPVRGSPQQPFKKAKTVFAFPQQARNLTTSPVKKEKSSALLPNPTIQLATQRPFGQNGPFDMAEVLKSDSKKVVRPIILSAEQEHVLRLAKEGNSIFFTGSAGTGKSVLLKSIIKALKLKYGPGGLAVTASTGLAACNIGGITVHSFAGIGLGKGSVEDLIKTVRKNRKAVNRWNSIQALVIDEVSMIDGRLFDKIDWVSRNIRRKHKLPFGGIQIVICGDFYQLPPVSKAEIRPDGTEHREEALFAFESESWKSSIKSTIILKEVFRQKGDQKFIDMLNDMRNGIVTPETEAEFLRLSRPLKCPAGIVPTELYATRFEVENANNIKLARLPGDARKFEARDGGSLPPLTRVNMLQNFLAPSKLFLKENAQVMCIKNFDDTLVNGSLGQVIKFVDRDTYMCTTIMNENPDMSLDETKSLLLKAKVEFELSQRLNGTVDPTMTERVIEEVKSLQPLLDSVFNFFYEDKKPVVISTLTDEMSQEDAIEMNKQRKLEFIQNLQKSSKGERYPLVRFLNPDGATTRDVLVEPEKWEIIDDVTGEVLVYRVQLPLMLAWALSIHKSQGQTLQKVKVDLTRIFENGQAYVALSRAVARDGLQVVNFRKEKVRTHRIVEDFYETLSTSEELARNSKD